MSKISIRFFNDREVRAVWDDDHNKWWFSATDIVRAIRSSSAGLLPEGRKNDEDDYVKAGNYWRWLKKKFNTEGIQLVSVTHDFKFQAPDGKQRFADALDAECVQTVANNYPNNRARKFLEWFTYSDTTIDGQSQKKAYTLFESGLMETLKPGTVKALQQIHAYLFGGLYDFAGKIRTKTISKGNTLFCLAEHLHNYLKTVEAMPENTFEEIIDKYVEMNADHPFMEGNGRSTRIWLDLILKKRLGLCVDWSKVGKKEYLNAMIESQTDSTHIKQLLKQALTDKINDRETFMKGIDYSFYYEQAD